MAKNDIDQVHYSDIHSHHTSPLQTPSQDEQLFLDYGQDFNFPPEEKEYEEDIDMESPTHADEATPHGTALVVDARVLVFQSKGLYQLEQHSHLNSRRLIHQARLPMHVFMLGKKSSPKPMLMLAQVLAGLTAEFGAADPKPARGHITCMVRLCEVTYDQAVSRHLAPLACIQQGMSQYLHLERVWLVDPPLPVNFVAGGPARWVPLSQSDRARALSRVVH